MYQLEQLVCCQLRWLFFQEKGKGFI
ncbi:uncharacterized protein METZ01_LOCUS6558 [marine metagenome]|uniref:Uncharacterized protein n=1 Tax=marine metagenome TaxID=408172 RepID=A0A381NHX4_9ZZZZ